MPDTKLPTAPEGYDASDTLPEVPDDHESDNKYESALGKETYCDICWRWQISGLLKWSRVPSVWYHEYPRLRLWRGVCTYTMIMIKKEIYSWLK